MKNGHPHGLLAFGDTDAVAVQRGLAELRAQRPLIIRSDGDAVVALPIDGAQIDCVAAFKALLHPTKPRLAVTARRAKALGLDTAGPALVDLDPADDAETIFALAADVDTERTVRGMPAGPAAAAAIELAKLAQQLPALLVAPVEAGRDTRFEPGLLTVAAPAVGKFRHEIIRSLEIAGEAQVPLNNGISTRFVVFRDAIGGSPVAIIVGEPDFSEPVPVRLHSACLTGDVFGSRRCDCGDQLKLAVKTLQEAGGGVILYLQQEGRGLGLANKMRAYALQDLGLDTVDANTTLGFEDDERDYGAAARMLEILGCNRIVMLTNNPDKLGGLSEAGIEISRRLPLNTPIHAHNRRYLSALALRAGHMLDGVLDSEVSEQNPV
jgi:GTP cyclohydrolase II